MESKNKQAYLVTSSLESGNDNVFFYSKKETGSVQLILSFDGGMRPSYHLYDEKKSLLYVVNEKNKNLHGESGIIRVYHIDLPGKEYKLRGEFNSLGDDPCFLTFDPLQRFLICANYSGSGISVFKISNNGMLLEAIQQFKWEGSGPNPERQEKSHPHSICFSPEGRYCFVPDLGCDQIRAFEMNNGDAPLKERRDLNIGTRAGAGPRMMAFTPDGDQAWLVNELDNTANLYAYSNGQLRFQNSICLSENSDVENNPSHIYCMGNMAYVSNRGENSLVKIENQKTTIYPGTGLWPRYFHIVEEEQALLVGWQHSNKIGLYKIEDTGTLKFDSHLIDVPQPSCISNFKHALS